MTKDILYKPRIACLLTHQPAWDFVGVLQEVGRDVFECAACKIRFMYPTKKDEKPVYEKF